MTVEKYSFIVSSLSRFLEVEGSILILLFCKQTSMVWSQGAFSHLNIFDTIKLTLSQRGKFS